MGTNRLLGLKVKPVLESAMLVLDRKAALLLDAILMGAEQVPAVSMMVASLLNEMYRLLVTKVSRGAEFPCTEEAEQMDSLLLGVTVMIISLIWAVQAVLGVGRLGKDTMNWVSRGMVCVMGTSILLFLTTVVLEMTLLPKVMKALRARLLRLSNWMGRSTYKQEPVVMATVLTSWNCEQMLEKEYRLEATPTMFSTLATPVTVDWMVWQGTSKDRSAQARLELFCSTPTKMYLLGYALFVQTLLGAASPMMLITQEDPAVLVLGLLVTMSWQGVLGSTAQGMTAESRRQQASCWKSCGEQQEGKLMTQSMFWSMLRSVLTMVMSICCLQPSVLKQEAMEMLLVMSGLKVGKMTLAELTMVQVQSNTLRQIMLNAPLDCEAGVQMPQMVITQLVAVSCVGSVKEKMIRQLTLSIEKRGQRTTPSARVMMMLSLAGSELTSLRSCPITKANSSSLQSILGSEN